ncbi:hypothetical protein C8J56DRAFT_905381 [Mycena floridula]|nr:hypothetical protein C8J56DRAFT_905381 [Mycena floridula]
MGPTPMYPNPVFSEVAFPSIRPRTHPKDHDRMLKDAVSFLHHDRNPFNIHWDTALIRTTDDTLISLIKTLVSEGIFPSEKIKGPIASITFTCIDHALRQEDKEDSPNVVYPMGELETPYQLFFAPGMVDPPVREETSVPLIQPPKRICWYSVHDAVVPGIYTISGMRSLAATLRRLSINNTYIHDGDFAFPTLENVTFFCYEELQRLAKGKPILLVQQEDETVARQHLSPLNIYFNTVSQGDSFRLTIRALQPKPDPPVSIPYPLPEFQSRSATLRWTAVTYLVASHDASWTHWSSLEEAIDHFRMLAKYSELSVLYPNGTRRAFIGTEAPERTSDSDSDTVPGSVPEEGVMEFPSEKKGSSLDIRRGSREGVSGSTLISTEGTTKGDFGVVSKEQEDQELRGEVKGVFKGEEEAVTEDDDGEEARDEEFSRKGELEIGLCFKGELDSEGELAFKGVLITGRMPAWMRRRQMGEGVGLAVVYILYAGRGFPGFRGDGVLPPLSSLALRLKNNCLRAMVSNALLIYCVIYQLPSEGKRNKVTDLLAPCSCFFIAPSVGCIKRQRPVKVCAIQKALELLGTFAFSDNIAVSSLLKKTMVELVICALYGEKSGENKDLIS